MATSLFSAQPADQGLYRSEHEHDACGVALVATMRGSAGHDIVDHALTALRNLEHRGATGADPLVGDGAGILTQIPDAFLREVVDFDLPPRGAYAAGIAFLPTDDAERSAAVATIESLAAEEGLRVLGWRDVPVAVELVGQVARDCMPVFRQLFVAAASRRVVGLGLERLAFCLRKRAEHEAQVYFPSLSARTMVYKGMLTTGQLEPFFPDLSDRRFATELALVHSRFSTNTFPSWPLAHPYRMIAHNGEINTVKGNRNWMRARESQLASDVIPGDLNRLFPICTPGGSDSATFDEVLELLHLGGRSLPHAVLMMIPEAWENHTEMDPARRAFYEFNSTFIEPWDGPACVTFTDGTVIGAVLDRNGLRPGRYWVTDDGLVVLASETGVLDLEPSRVVRKGRLQPGRMFLVDTEHGRLVSDDEVKSSLAAEHPYEEWLHAGEISLTDLPEREHIVHTASSVARRQQTFGYTQEELRILLSPMARSGAEALGSMGTDSPIAVLSDRPRLIFDYFTQLFAQVTNPPLDSIREELVTSLGTTIGPEGNALTASPAHARQLLLPFPVIDNDELAKIVHINADGDLPGYATHVVRGLYDVSGGAEAMQARLEQIFTEVSAAIAEGARFVVLSDRDSGRDLAPIPSLLLTSAVHHHLIREKTRTRVGLLVEAGDVREVHHVALLIGFGAAAVNPYLAMESVEDLVRSRPADRGRGGQGGGQPHQGARQGRPEGDVQDGHLHGRLLPRRPGVRGDRPRAGAGRPLLHRHRLPARRHRPGRRRGRGRRPARDGLPAGRGPAAAPQARRGRGVPVAPRGRAAPVRPRHRLPAAALHPPAPLRHLQAVHRQGRRAGRAADDPARAVRLRHRPHAGAAGGGRAGQLDRRPVQHRRDELRLDQPGGARDARRGDEPARRPLQHR